MNLSFGRVPSPFDIRDGKYKLSNYIPRLAGLEQSRSWGYNQNPLDQDITTHCVGFSGVNWEINAPTESQHTNQDGHALYYLCKEYDKEPGMENGSCIRSLAKALQSQGKLVNYAWASSVDEISWWLLNKGPIIAGTDWTESMCNPSPEFVIQPEGEAISGHAYLINEKKERFYGIVSSWDNYWGLPGQCKAYIAIEQFAELLRQQGEAMAGVEQATVKKEGCLSAFTKLFYQGE